MNLSPEIDSPVAAATGWHATLAALGRRLFPRRFAFGLLVVGCTAFFLRRPGGWGPLDELAHWLSPLLIAAGFSLRAWAGGCAGLHTREDALCSPRLVTGGPFAHVRNPIYVGTAVLGLGVVGVLGDPWLLLPWAFAIGALYSAIIPAEERHLSGQFGASYEVYRGAVPRVRPRLTPWRAASPAPFRWSGAAGEAPLIAVVAAIIFLLHWLQTRGV